MSGQVAIDKQGNLIGKDDMEKQTEQVFQNIREPACQYACSGQQVISGRCAYRDRGDGYYTEEVI
ncbi:MAG TPA: Rid family hydrolase [Puia sp.]|nr:Rid family hydrolase [Puia sp.]